MKICFHILEFISDFNFHFYFRYWWCIETGGVNKLQCCVVPSFEPDLMQELTVWMKHWKILQTKLSTKKQTLFCVKLRELFVAPVLLDLLTGIHWIPAIEIGSVLRHVHRIPGPVKVDQVVTRHTNPNSIWVISASHISLEQFWWFILKSIIIILLDSYCSNQRCGLHPWFPWLSQSYSITLFRGSSRLQRWMDDPIPRQINHYSMVLGHTNISPPMACDYIT